MVSGDSGSESNSDFGHDFGSDGEDAGSAASEPAMEYGMSELEALLELGIVWTSDDPSEARPEVDAREYCVVDKKGRYCSLVDGALESGKKLYLCGTICLRHGRGRRALRMVRGAGPIRRWWMFGFDSTVRRAFIGVDTDVCCYYFQEPTSGYRPIMLPLIVAAQLSQ